MSFQLLLFDFSGRIDRKWFWIGSASVVAMVVVGTFLLSMLNPGSGGWVLSNGIVRPKLGGASVMGLLASGFLVLLAVYMQAAVSVKRWHDRGKTGRWYLVSFIPYVGWLWIIVENGFLAGTEGSNRYGPDPAIDPVAALQGN